MKGITPVISVILLLLVAIAIVGFAFGFFQRIFGVAGSGAEEQLKQSISQLSQGIWAENAKGTKVTVRNLGSQSVNANNFAIFVNGGAVSASCSPATVSPGSITECTLGAGCTAGQEVKVSGPSNTATTTCL